MSPVSCSPDNTSLDSSSVGNSFIRVDSLAWFLSIEEFLDELLDLGDSSGASNQHDFINVLLGQV